MDERLKQLVNDTNYSLENIKLIEKAWDFAKKSHEGHFRLNGEPYIEHCLAIAETLISWKLDAISVVSGLVHDAASEGTSTQEDITREFGVEVSNLVNGVTKITGIRLRGSSDSNFVENLRKMLLVMAKDLRVLLIKLADRLHNMETLDALPVDVQKENALETLEIYAPLAERMGIGQVKGMLEDLAFSYAYPKEYKRILTESKLQYKNAEKDIERMKRALLTGLAQEKIIGEVHARKKRLYSLWRKLERPGIDWNFKNVNDIIAIRIITNTVSECYAVLGIVHELYKPVPYIGISDFIAQPKPNGYQSLHTKVFGANGRIVEIQIRTYGMHSQAEHGIAAHWAYSDLKAGSKSHNEIVEKGVIADEKKLAWVRKLVAWQQDLKETSEFIQAVKFEALSHRNFIFSPKGDVFDLPTGATPVDFAFAVHSDLGKFIKGAKVDGKVVPLSYKLQSGQVVEIIKSKNPRLPNRQWLDFVVTQQARREIWKNYR